MMRPDVHAALLPEKEWEAPRVLDACGIVSHSPRPSAAGRGVSRRGGRARPDGVPAGRRDVRVPTAVVRRAGPAVGRGGPRARAGGTDPRVRGALVGVHAAAAAGSAALSRERAAAGPHGYPLAGDGLGAG